MKKSFFLPMILLIAWLKVPVYAQGDLHYAGDAFECKTCHGPHLKQVNAPLLPSGNTVEEFCIGCHNELGPAPAPIGIHENDPSSGNGFSFRISCNVCHNPHRNENLPNIKNIRKEIQYLSFAGKRSVNYRSRNDFVLKNSESGFYGICEVCHKNTLHHRDNGQDSIPAHYKKWWGASGTGRSLPVCMACHPHDDKFHKQGSQHCTDCHAIDQPSSQVKPPRTRRRAIVGEFSLTGHHMTLDAGPIKKNLQCLVCHDVLEHRKGKIRLKDPDDDTNIISFTQFTTDEGADPYDPTQGLQRNEFLAPTPAGEVTQDDLMNKFCFKCHDLGGALDEDNFRVTGTTATETTPFDTAIRLDADGQFAISNTFYHPVKAYRNNPYCDVDTLTTTYWDLKNTGQSLNCWDCHAINGHGGNNTDLLLIETYADDPGNSNFRTAQKDFCTRCHKSGSYYSGSSGSRFGSHSRNQHRGGYGCRNCHAGLVNRSGLPDNGTGKTKIHGYSFTWPSGPTSGLATEHFMLGGYLNGWKDSRCYGGNCAHSSGRSY